MSEMISVASLKWDIEAQEYKQAPLKHEEIKPGERLGSYIKRDGEDYLVLQTDFGPRKVHRQFVEFSY